MKKGIYRAVGLEEVNVEALRALVGGRRAVFAVDVAKDEHFGCVSVGLDEVLITVRWDAVAECEAIVELLVGLRASRLEVALEPTGTYGDSLRSALEKVGVPLYRVSTKRCHDLSEVHDGVPSSHDAKAAAVIAELHWRGRSERWEFRAPANRELRAAVETMELFDKQWHDNTNRLHAKLMRHWPEVTRLLSVTSATLVSLLSRFGGPAEVSAHREEARALLRSVSRGRLKEGTAEAVLQSAEATVGVAPVPGEAEALRVLAEEAERNRKRAAEAKQKVEELSSEVPAVASMAAVVGKATAGVLATSAGDPTRYPSPQAYRKALGLNLKVRSSGKMKGRLRLSKRGPGRARRWLYYAALRLLQSNAIVKAWYARKRATRV